MLIGVTLFWLHLAGRVGVDEACPCFARCVFSVSDCDCLLALLLMRFFGLVTPAWFSQSAVRE